MAAAITVSVAGVSYSAVNIDGRTEEVQTVAHQADCRAVETAIVAFVAQNNAVPRQIADIKPLVHGDISAFTITDGLADGPGCTPVTVG